MTQSRFLFYLLNTEAYKRPSYGALDPGLLSLKGNTAMEKKHKMTR